MNSKELQNECKNIKDSINNTLTKFRDLGVDKYCAEMWFNHLFIQSQFERLKSCLDSLIAEDIISNSERFKFISDATQTTISLSDQSDLIENFKEILEYTICVQSEIKYKIELSRFTSYRLIRSEEKRLKNKQEVELLEAIFLKNVNYLTEKGDVYDV